METQGSVALEEVPLLQHFGLVGHEPHGSAQAAGVQVELGIAGADHGVAGDLRTARRSTVFATKIVSHRLRHTSQRRCLTVNLPWIRCQPRRRIR